MKLPSPCPKREEKGSTSIFEEERRPPKRDSEGPNIPEKTFFCPQDGYLRAKREFSHAIYAMGREEKAEAKAVKRHFVCL